MKEHHEEQETEINLFSFSFHHNIYVFKSKTNKHYNRSNKDT